MMDYETLLKKYPDTQPDVDIKEGKEVIL